MINHFVLYRKGEEWSRFSHGENFRWGVHGEQTICLAENLMERETDWVQMAPTVISLSWRKSDSRSEEDGGKWKGEEVPRPLKLPEVSHNGSEHALVAKKLTFLEKKRWEEREVLLKGAAMDVESDNLQAMGKGKEFLGSLQLHMGRRIREGRNLVAHLKGKQGGVRRKVQQAQFCMIR